MRRSELREHIFRMVFGLDFNEGEEIPEQIQLYFEQLDDVKERDMEYIREKAEHIAEKREEIDALLNTHTKGWKTSRMNKVDLSILRVAVYEMKWDWRGLEDLNPGDCEKRKSADGSFLCWLFAKE